MDRQKIPKETLKKVLKNSPDNSSEASKEVNLDTYHCPERPKIPQKGREKNSPDNSSEASKEVDEGEDQPGSVHQHLGQKH